MVNPSALALAPYRDTLIIMGKGISKQEEKILQLLEKQGKSLPKFPWMSTREIVMALHPEVEAYLAEDRRYSRWIHRNMLSLSVEEVHKRYQEHLERLKALPNYHTVRTSINRALRSLARLGLVVRQPYWGMYQRQGMSAGWLLPQYMPDSLKATPEWLQTLRYVYGPGSKEREMEERKRRAEELLVKLEATSKFTTGHKAHLTSEPR